MSDDGKKMTIAEFASMGGKARARKLSAARRSEIARKAVLVRWRRKREDHEKLRPKT